MKYKKLCVLVSAVVAVLVFYQYVPSIPTDHSISTYLPRRNAAPLYDHFVQTEYGRAIKVARVIDGDTVELVNGDRLRYIGIDTPEEVDPRKPIQCFAKEAAAANQALVEGKSIISYKDTSLRDKYGRWLGFVYLNDGTFVNLELVQKGFAFSYPYKPDISRAREFEKAETEARFAGRGLWTACRVYRTSTGREQTNFIQP